MPEIAEVRLTSDFINKHGKKNFVRIEKSPFTKVKTPLDIGSNKFNLISISRGKEMLISFFSEGEFLNNMKVTLGMSGAWIYYDPNDERMQKYHKHVHLRIIEERGFILGLYDIRRFAKWSWGNFDTKRRGPCPLRQRDNFQNHILENWNSHKDFKKHTLSEIMMSQRWFNGVGNYLRAEILYRLDRNPFQKASELPAEDVKRLVDLTCSCAQQAYMLGGGQLKDWKNPEGEDPTSFKEWMKCYGILEKTTDSTGRTFWYDEKWKND